MELAPFGTRAFDLEHRHWLVAGPAVAVAVVAAAGCRRGMLEAA